ncbi:hypothetical protein EDC04DRAFT_2609024 [Pisolithus marmoratus]|nr:hypothetical protein EDC04DRAFT_2609024 [Pisolithus marmoratus]
MKFVVCDVMIMQMNDYKFQTPIEIATAHQCKLRESLYSTWEYDYLGNISFFGRDMGKLMITSMGLWVCGICHDWGDCVKLTQFVAQNKIDLQVAYKNLTPVQQEAYNAEVQAAQDKKVLVVHSNPKTVSHTISAAFVNMDWESWAVSGIDVPAVTKYQCPLNKLISKCCSLIQEELDYLLTKKKVKAKVKMNYTNYEHQIVECYGVMLRGWLLSGAVQNPSKIGGHTEVEKLLDALNSEACK